MASILKSARRVLDVACISAMTIALMAGMGALAEMAAQLVGQWAGYLTIFLLSGSIVIALRDGLSIP